jgi:hypothetical protein
MLKFLGLGTMAAAPAALAAVIPSEEKPKADVSGLRPLVDEAFLKHVDEEVAEIERFYSEASAASPDFFKSYQACRVPFNTLPMARLVSVPQEIRARVKPPKLQGPDLGSKSLWAGLTLQRLLPALWAGVKPSWLIEVDSVPSKAEMQATMTEPWMPVALPERSFSPNMTCDVNDLDEYTLGAMLCAPFALANLLEETYRSAVKMALMAWPESGAAEWEGDHFASGLTVNWTAAKSFMFEANCSIITGGTIYCPPNMLSAHGKKVLPWLNAKRSERTHWSRLPKELVQGL